MKRRPASTTTPPISASSLAAIEETLCARFVTREEFSSYCARTDAAIADRDKQIAARDAAIAKLIALTSGGDEVNALTTAGDEEDHAIDSNWKSIKEVMFKTNRKYTTVRKWIKLRKVRSRQPGGPRKAIRIDIDSIPAAWVRR